MSEPNATKGFGSDNHAGVHPAIMESLVHINSGHSPSYGTDPLSHELYKLVEKLFGSTAEAHMVFNGTAANVLAIKSLVSSHHSIVCTTDSHLNVDECGAPEANIGCKLIAVPTEHGKLTPAQVEETLIRKGDQHFSQVKAISITQPTELGTLYSKEEMLALSQCAKQHGLFFHVDGARFIYAAEALNATFKELTADVGVDALSFGGTKNGLLFGEMVILFNDQAKKDFKYVRKQQMQLPSKMRFLAAQFLQLLGPEELWKQIAREGHSKALELATRLKDIDGVEVVHPVQANSVFMKFPQA